MPDERDSSSGQHKHNADGGEESAPIPVVQAAVHSAVVCHAGEVTSKIDADRAHTGRSAVYRGRCLAIQNAEGTTSGTGSSTW